MPRPGGKPLRASRRSVDEQQHLSGMSHYGGVGREEEEEAEMNEHDLQPVR